MAVMRGERSAARAAALLGVSRQTFYEWYNRALGALEEALTDRVPGRPAAPPADPEKARLERDNDRLRRELRLMKDAILIRDALDGVPRFRDPEPDLPPVSRSKKKP